MKKLLALLLAAVMTLALAACGGGNAGNAGSAGADAGSNAGSSAPEDGGDAAAYLVGICQYAPHPALDAATQGFKDALNELLPGQVEIDEQNAAGDSPTCATIANGFVSANVDLIMANATAPLQAAAAATTDIPVLGTSITEYGVALGIDNFSGTVGSNVSGTSDLAPLEQQAAMVQEWFPDARNVGLLYCSGEPNSKYQVDTVQGYLEELGYACTQYPSATRPARWPRRFSPARRTFPPCPLSTRPSSPRSTTRPSAPTWASPRWRATSPSPRRNNVMC